MAKKTAIALFCLFFLGLGLYIFKNAPAAPKMVLSPAVSGISTDKKSAAEQKLININTAGEAELDLLPSVGPATAKRIIAYRQEHGKFDSISGLKKIKGISDRNFNKLKDSVSAE